VCGLGHKPGVITPEHHACVTLTELYAEMFHRMAAMMETTCGKITLEVEAIVTEEVIVIKTGTIPAGTGKATIWHWSATLANGIELHLRSHWHVGEVEGWDRRNVWICEVDGEPNFRAEMVLEHSGADGLTNRGYDPNGRALAATCVNALPEVMTAEPGIFIPPSFAHYRPRFGAED
jgi:2,4-diaminopentanoate dehydrogenase